MKIDLHSNLRNIEWNTQHGDNVKKKKKKNKLIMQAIQSFLLSRKEGPSQYKNQTSQNQQPTKQTKKKKISMFNF